MPGLDGTGPRGTGPLTGGGRGYCVAEDAGYGVRPRLGRAFGRGGGRGYRNRFYATGMTGRQRAMYGYPAYREDTYARLTKEQEQDMLKNEAETLKQDLELVQKRIKALQGETVDKEEER